MPNSEEPKNQTFVAIGAFIFQFSQLEYAIRHVLSRILKLRNEQFDAVTSPYDFVSLCTVTQTILKQKWPIRSGDIDKLFNRCKELNNERVRIAHGFWADDGTALTARHVARGTLKAGEFFKNTKELEGHTDTARRLMADLFDMFRRDPDGDSPR